MKFKQSPWLTCVAGAALLANLTGVAYAEATPDQPHRPRAWAMATTIGAVVAANVVLAAGAKDAKGAPSEVSAAVAGGLFGYALVLGPLPGHMLADRTGYGAAAALGRLALIGAGLGLDYALFLRHSDGGDPIPAFTLLATCASVAWTVVDLVKLPSVYPDARVAHKTQSFAFAPTIGASPHTVTSAGVSMMGRF
ncbi:MAG: hypothetical protein SF187_12895 [Deltaproteobacteria bacterium]|nr:hypothetical protein [Deltaproteobacteria bacterium]